MSIGKNGSINVIYNGGKLEQRKRPVISGSSVKNDANESSYANNISQSEQTIKFSDISNNNDMQNSTSYYLSDNISNQIDSVIDNVAKRNDRNSYLVEQQNYLEDEDITMDQYGEIYNQY